MEILLWEKADSWLSVLKFSQYSGPWPIKSLLVDQDRIVVAVGNRLLLVNVETHAIEASKLFQSTITQLQHKKGKIIAISSNKLHLLSQNLQLSRQFRLYDGQIITVSSDDSIFKILYTGSEIKNTPVVRFIHLKNTDNTSWAAYHRCRKLTVQNTKLLVTDQQTKAMVEYELGRNIDGQLRLECCNQIPILILNNQDALCLSPRNLKPLYAFNFRNFRVAGDCLIQEKESQLQVLKVSEDGLVSLGHIPRAEIFKLLFRPKSSKLIALSLKNSAQSTSLVISECQPELPVFSRTNSQLSSEKSEQLLQLHKVQSSFVQQVIENLMPVTMEQEVLCVPQYNEQCFNSLQSTLSRRSLSNIEQVEQSLFSNNQSVMRKQPADNLFHQNSLPTAHQLLSELDPNDRQQQLLIRKLSLVRQETVDYCTYQYLKKQPIRQLIYNFYKPRNKYGEAVQCFLKQLIQGSPQQIVSYAKQTNQYIANTIQKLVKLHPEVRQQILHLCLPLLSNVPLREVPLSIAPISQSHVKILLQLCPGILFGQLSHGPTLLQTMMKIYYEKQHTELSVCLDDQRVNIAQPRNMLNVLLYFGQFYQVSVTQTLKIYCKAAAKYGDLSVVNSILYEEDVLEVCQVPLRLFVEEVIREIEEEAYTEDRAFGEELMLIKWKCPWSLVARRRLKILRYLQSEGTQFKKSVYFRVGSSVTVFQFLSDIIQNLDVVSLSSFNLQYIYDKVRVLELSEPQKPCLTLSFYTVQLALLMEHLIIKLICHHLLAEAYKKMQCIKSRLHASTVLLAISVCLEMEQDPVREFMALTGSLESPDLLNVLRQLLRGQKKSIFRRSREKQFSCTYGDFKSELSKQQFMTPLPHGNKQALSLLIYCNPTSSLQLCRVNKIIDEKSLSTFLQRCVDSGILSKKYCMDDKIAQPSSKTCFDLPLALQRKLSSSSIGSIDETMLPLSHQSLKKHSRSSTNIIPSRVSEDARNSSVIIEPMENEKDKLQAIYEEEGPVKLREYYKLNSSSMKLFHLDELCELQELKMGYDFKRIFPFQFLLKNQGCLDSIEQNIVAEMTVKRYWLINFMVKRVLGEKVQSRVAYMFLKKQIKEEVNQKQLKERFGAILENVQLEQYQIDLLNELATKKGVKISY